MICSTCSGGICMMKYLGGGEYVVLGTEVNTVLGLLHATNHGARQVDPPMNSIYIQKRECNFYLFIKSLTNILYWNWTFRKSNISFEFAYPKKTIWLMTCGLRIAPSITSVPSLIGWPWIEPFQRWARTKLLQRCSRIKPFSFPLLPTLKHLGTYTLQYVQ